jgi:hypothetical protein
MRHPELRKLYLNSADSLSPTGLSGGIVQVPAECKSTEQKNGVGMTVYHFVDSIEDVSFPIRAFPEKRSLLT